jgi:hypothetical protein
MATEKVSLTLNEQTLREARKQVGRRGLSKYVDEALRIRLQHDRLRALLAEMEAERGPIPHEVMEEVRREWDRGTEQLAARRRPPTSKSSRH